MDRGEIVEAKKMLTAIRQQFTEGLSLRDIRDADDLLRTAD
jgi:hypothetical protein